eukprot:12715729-Heterocapsa_arctica.AAC.1
MVTHGLRRFIGDPKLYQHADTKALVSIHADDILIAAPPGRVAEIKNLMETGLKIRWGEEVGRESWV